MSPNIATIPLAAQTAVRRAFHLAELLGKNPDFAKQALVRVFGQSMAEHLFDNLLNDNDVARWVGNLDEDNLTLFLSSTKF